MPARSMPTCEVRMRRCSSEGVKAVGSEDTSSSSTKKLTGRPSAPATFSRVVIVGVIPLCSILWIAAADTWLISASWASESPASLRSRRIFGPMPEEMVVTSSVIGACSLDHCASGLGGRTLVRHNCRVPGWWTRLPLTRHRDLYNIVDEPYLMVNARRSTTVRRRREPDAPADRHRRWWRGRDRCGGGGQGHGSRC